MTSSKNEEGILHSSVNECDIKLSLVTDYLERFKIQDMRLVAPIKDLERCVQMMQHALHPDDCEGCSHE